MLRILRPALFAILALSGGALGAQAEPPTVARLADGIFAVIQPEAMRFNDSNTLVVDLGDGLVVVDTQASLAATRRTIAAIREASGKPVGHLVLTHWHGDHVQGIQAYREIWPEVEVVSHRTAREDVTGRAEPALAEEIESYRSSIAAAIDKLEAGLGLDDEPLDEAGRVDLASRIARAEAALAERLEVPLPLVLPDLTYADQLTLHGPSRRVRLFHFRAHTRGDTLVHLPDDGILATGDVVDDLPFGGHGYPTSWLAGLRELEALPFDVLVPGHGSIRHGKEHLVLVREMTESLVAQAAASAAAGRNLEATVDGLDLEAFRGRLAGDDERAGRAWNAFIPATAERAWLEARGELED